MERKYWKVSWWNWDMKTHKDILDFTLQYVRVVNAQYEPMTKLHQDSWNNTNKIQGFLESQEAKTISGIGCLWGQVNKYSDLKTNFPKTCATTLTKSKVLWNFKHQSQLLCMVQFKRPRWWNFLKTCVKKYVSFVGGKMWWKEPSLREIKHLTWNALRIFSTKTFEAEKTTADGSF